ncbi:uncharacterized protein LOC131029349 isoform X2 [Cryptomeria japonica]|uniref:uncharacterized protein LOC131029349 isoform X2 n=1 Tax=Cryptomeria japonica TaxID=3369 RepID=UPI0027DA6A62|nr:uncharacterized protein LOC131029349 isoform X2 [Cryptomeria japonica]
MAMAMAAAASSFFTGSSLPKKVDVSFSPHLFLTKKIPMQMQQLKIEAASKEKTSRENRIARHIRIRKKDTAKKIGEAIAKACLEKGITKVAFDRGGFVYHGRIKALADAARENGLDF